MNLLDTIKSELSSETVNSLSQRLSITPDQTQTGLGAIIPSILGGILKKGAGSGSLGALGSIFTGNLKSVEAEDEVEDDSSLLSRGSNLLGNIFGENSNAVGTAVAQKANLSTEKGMSLLTMATPIVLHHISKLISNRGWSMPDFLGKLFEEKGSIENSLPGGLGASLGLAGLSLPHLNQPPNINTNIPPVVDHVKTNTPPIERVVPHSSITPEPSSSSGNILKWIIIIAILALLAWWFLGRKNEMTPTTPLIDTISNKMNVDTIGNRAKELGSKIAGTLDEAGDWVYNLGATTSLALSDGETLHVGENSSESKIFSFITDNSKMVNDTTWFSLDRLYFETGKATLKPESQEQLSNIAAIMKSYPNVHLKIGGYTDNTGSAETNKQVSTARANAAMKELIGLGISADRLKAEGYGQDHPLADNATAEGRAQNRRIDVRVTQK